MDYPYDITVKIDGIAASAASVIAMAGTKVCMSPVAMMMIHNPSTAVMGDASDLKDAIAMLNEVKESIINAYETKTLLDRDKLSRMMDNTTWMNARKALELNFCDEILFTEETKAIAASASAFSPNIVNKAFITKFRSNHPAEETKVSAEQLMNRLNLLAH
jgi:ATP-dependent Clp protease protease subunit